MVPYRVTHSAAPLNTFSHIAAPLAVSPRDQEIDRPLRRYIQPASSATVARITGPANDS
ncbi:hypothetical protein D3C81_2220800 [compost metagenome]